MSHLQCLSVTKFLLLTSTVSPTEGFRTRTELLTSRHCGFRTGGLFNRHRKERGLSRKRLGRQGYRAWLSQTWTETLEFAWYKEGKLVCISILDRGDEASSAVYCHYDPSLSERSLGTLAILKTIEWARAKGLKWHYLGLYVEDNPHLSYKARFTPHERLVDGVWQPVAPQERNS